jgi:hypothetical protein
MSLISHLSPLFSISEEAQETPGITRAANLPPIPAHAASRIAEFKRGQATTAAMATISKTYGGTYLQGIDPVAEKAIWPSLWSLVCKRSTAALQLEICLANSFFMTPTSLLYV